MLVTLSTDIFIMSRSIVASFTYVAVTAREHHHISAFLVALAALKSINLQDIKVDFFHLFRFLWDLILNLLRQESVKNSCLKDELCVAVCSLYSILHRGFISFVKMIPCIEG